MIEPTPERLYRIRHSEKCFRFKPEAFTNHAPPFKGIYELVTFDENQNPQVLYIGAAFEKTILESLEAHANGTLTPTAADLSAKYPNLYFDYLTEMSAKTLDEALDVYWWMVQKHQPVFADSTAVRPSDRPGEVRVEELD